MKPSPSIAVFFVVACLLFAFATSGSASDDQKAQSPSPVGEQGFDINDEFDFLQETEFVESAARHRQEIGMSPSAITVMTREEIETSGASTIPDLLRLVPGMTVVSSSPAFYAAFSRYQFNFVGNTFRVLVDGREINLELLGAPLWEAEPISISDIERIEVIRGPVSALYGANAYSGLISITTRAIPEKTSVWAKLGGGEAGMLGVGARASTRIGPLGFSLIGMSEQAGLFVDPRELSKQTKKVRSLIEYQSSSSTKWLLDVGFSGVTGTIPSGTGNVGGNFNLATARFAYESNELRGHLAWNWMPGTASLQVPLDFNNIRLATFLPMDFNSHVADGELQVTLPTFYQPLLLIVGASGRFAWLGSDNSLDANNFADVSSSRYRQMGLDFWEMRGGLFAHSEYSPADWVTVTGGLRYDTNVDLSGDFALDSDSKARPFLSYRLASVFKPWIGHFFRLGLGRSYMKPNCLQTAMHPGVEFPKDSPIQGTQQVEFQEFMARIMTNWDLSNEELLAFEVGYQGHFFDSRLSVSIDLYYNREYKTIGWESNIALTDQGFPDLGKSMFRLISLDRVLQIAGGELSARLVLSPSLTLVASWSHLQLFDLPHLVPKNLFTLGGRYRTSSGLVGSLYVFGRSDFVDTATNPEGLLEPSIPVQLRNTALVLGRCGWQFNTKQGIQFETGVNLFLPVTLTDPLQFTAYERAGGVTLDQKRYGGVELARMMTVYLQGSY